MTGVEDEWTGLPLVNRSMRSLPPEPFRRLGGGAVRAAILACEEAEEEGRQGPSRRARSPGCRVCSECS